MPYTRPPQTLQGGVWRTRRCHRTDAPASGRARPGGLREKTGGRRGETPGGGAGALGLGVLSRPLERFTYF